jgi:uncharacterized protein (TIGR02588 family)
VTARPAAERPREARRGGERSRDEIPALEWAAAILGALLLVAAVVFLLREATKPSHPGPIVFRVVAVRPVDPGFVVEFEARNRGGAAYAELLVEATLRGAGGGGEERAHATLDYLPRGSARRGGFFFRGDPRSGALEIAARGYREP